MLVYTNMNRKASLLGWTLVVLLALAVGQRWLPADVTSTRNDSETAAASLAQFPTEEQQAIRDTVALLKDGGPFPYRKDGSEFSNREGRLPQKGSGYYREYTVTTPDSPDRGARRIVAGSAGEIYYTRD